MCLEGKNRTKIKYVVRKTRQQTKRIKNEITLRKKCPYLELLSSVFSRIWTEYGPEKLRIQTLFTQCNVLFFRFKQFIGTLYYWETKMFCGLLF